MYIVKVVPLKRRIPGGELSYITKSKVDVGSVIFVPIKNKQEQGLVIESSPAVEAKEFLKSLNYKLIKLEEVTIVSKINKKYIEAIQDFATYSIADFKDVLYKILNKTNFKNPKELNPLITITTKEIKNSDIVSFHAFFALLNTKNTTIKKIRILNPESFSIYGINILGFDLLPLFFFMQNKFGFEIEFDSSVNRLRWSEWNVSIPKRPKSEGKLAIISRSLEKHTTKSDPLTKEIVDYFKKQPKDKKILILASSKNIATRTMCSDCHQYHKCDTCDGFLVLAKNSRIYARKYGIAGEYIYVCPNCDYAENSIIKCRNCDSWNMTALGYGSEKIEEFIKNNLPKFYVHNEHSSKSIKNKKIIQESGGILIDRFNSVYELDSFDLVIVPSLSAYIYNSSFESGETIRNIVTSAENLAEKVIIQTMQDEEADFLSEENTVWLKKEISDRQELHYPPYDRHVIIKLDALASKSPKLANAIENIIKKHSIANTVSKNKDLVGLITISASFDRMDWSISPLKSKTPKLIFKEILPFLKYIQITVM